MNKEWLFKQGTADVDLILEGRKTESIAEELSVIKNAVSIS